MAINGLNGQYDLFQSYQSQNALSRIPIAGQDVPKTDVGAQQPGVRDREAQRQQEVQNQEVLSTLSPVQESGLADRTAASDLQDISLKFNRDEDINLVGRDSSLAGLDVEKAISDMRKDSMLEQYQYFVGSGSNIVNDEDGLVFQKFPAEMF
ncbi:MAG: hypothetical protein Q4G60_02880 [bacterium]|nr:hypothetical protein [bacterium]